MVLPHLRPAVVVIVTQEVAQDPAGRPCPTHTFTGVQVALVLLHTAAVDRRQSEARAYFHQCHLVAPQWDVAAFDIFIHISSRFSGRKNG